MKKISLLALSITISTFAFAGWSEMQNWVLEKAGLSTEKDRADFKLAMTHEFANAKAITKLAAAHIGYKLENDRKFSFYEDKTREFLKNLGYKNAATTPILILDENNYELLRDNRFVRWPSSFAHSDGIVLRFSLQKNKEQECLRLFTCAHEAAHIACGHTSLGRLLDSRNSFAIEKEADITAARMLCANGYRWVVEAEVDDLSYAFKSGDEHNDGIHPSYKEMHEYLSAVLQEPIKEKKPFIFDRQTVCLILTGIALVTIQQWYLRKSH